MILILENIVFTKNVKLLLICIKFLYKKTNINKVCIVKKNESRKRKPKNSKIGKEIKLLKNKKEQ